ELILVVPMSEPERTTWIGKLNQLYTQKYGTQDNTKSDRTVYCNYTDPFVVGDMAQNTVDIDQYLKTWDQEQLDIVNRIVIHDQLHKDIKYIGGMDISWENGTNNAIACLVIHRYDTMELAGVFTIKGTINIPYKPGYLAFREAPVMLELISNLRRDYPELVPQVIIVDGNGIWHPRG